MVNLNDLLELLPMDQIAGKLGVDTDTARATVATALPSLVAGMQNNAASPEGAEALQSAIAQHDASLVEGGVDLEAVDTDDGQKIVDHVLGDNQAVLAAQLNGATPEGFDLGGLVQKALPMLAPVVMSFLAKNASSSGNGGGFDIGGLLGGLLGGGPAAGTGRRRARHRRHARRPLRRRASSRANRAADPTSAACSAGSSAAATSSRASRAAGWTLAASSAGSSARSSPVRDPYRAVM